MSDLVGEATPNEEDFRGLGMTSLAAGFKRSPEAQQAFLAWYGISHEVMTPAGFGYSPNQSCWDAWERVGNIIRSQAAEIQRLRTALAEAEAEKVEAVKAERERCAGVALFWDRAENPGPELYRMLLAIASAIRRGEEA
jgi:hypothetical protein